MNSSEAKEGERQTETEKKEEEEAADQPTDLLGFSSGLEGGRGVPDEQRQRERRHILQETRKEGKQGQTEESEIQTKQREKNDRQETREEEKKERKLRRRASADSSKESGGREARADRGI